jgi:hypothetical protein
MLRKTLFLLLLLTLASVSGLAQDASKSASAGSETSKTAPAGSETSKVIPAASKVFINPINDGFEKNLIAAFEVKKVPLEIVTEKEKADFEISGISESKKAGAAKILLMGSWHSSEQASITVTNLKTGEAVWAYSVNKSDSAHGKRSTAEACAKHLKNKIDSKK